MPTSTTIWTVHQVRAGEVFASEAGFSDFDAACRYARRLSCQPRVLATAVTALLVDEPGVTLDRTRGFHGEKALFVRGAPQQSHWITDDKSCYRWGESRTPSPPIFLRERGAHEVVQDPQDPDGDRAPAR